MRQNYNDAQDNVERDTIQGENKIGNDNLWYFYPDETSKQGNEKYKDNLDL